MASIAELSADNPALAVQAAILARPATPERCMADAIRALAIDAVEKAKSGHPGMPMGMADVATVLWTRFHKFDAADPRWPDRDRFVLSAGHGSMLLYALLNLTGHAGMEIDKLKRFRQLHSPTAGHPEYGEHPAIETTTGPLGQGLATAVGMALAERMLAARFGRSLVDHRTWVIAGDGCLMEGISHEADRPRRPSAAEQARPCCGMTTRSRSMAPPASSTSTDQLKRFAAAGWAVKRVDGHDPAADRRRPVDGGALEEAHPDRLQDHHRLCRPDQGRHRRRAWRRARPRPRRRRRRTRWAGTPLPSRCPTPSASAGSAPAAAASPRVAPG